jgi:ferredoxin
VKGAKSMIINKNSILYFSGTGNTYDVTSKLAKACNLEVINISSLIKEEVLQINCEIIGVAFPIYYGGIPKIISEIISKMKLSKEQYIFALATYGGMPANPFKILERRLKEKNVTLGAGFLMNMPGNYLPLNGARKRSVQIKNFKKADKKIEEAAEIISSKMVVKYEKSPYLIDRPFDKLSEKRVEGLSALDVNFKVDDKCNNCGICSKICPTKNISIENGKLKWLGSCEQCMACIQHCPREAIQYGNKTVKRKRYTNPNVNYLKVLLNH